MSELSIVSVTIIHSKFGGDLVRLHTNRQSPCPGLSKEPLALEFNTSPNNGRSFVEEVLDFDGEINEIAEA